MATMDSTKNQPQPWSVQQPYLKQGYEAASNILDYQPSWYEGPYQGPRSAMSLEGEQAGLGLIRGEGGAGAGATGYLNDVLSGQYLSPESNPWLQGRYDDASQNISRDYMRTIAPQLSMEAMGRGGSGAEMSRTRGAQETLFDRLSQLENSLFGQHYTDERSRMGQAASLAPQVDASRRNDILAGYSTGARADEYANVPYQQAQAGHMFEQQIPYENLMAYTRAIGQPIVGSQQDVSRGFGASEGIGTATSLLGLLAMFSSREFKDRIAAVSPENVLIQLLQTDIDLWKYKDEFAEEHNVDTDHHIGPYAEDILENFHLGDGVRINIYDLIGISLASVQAMAIREANQNEIIERLEKRIEALELGGGET